MIATIGSNLQEANHHMFAAYLEEKSVWAPILVQPVLRESLEWIGKYAEGTKIGDYQLGKPNWYASIHGYSTLPESECCWENHMHTIDIQYLIVGRERIRWTSVNQLGAPRCYIRDKDRQEFDLPRFKTAQLIMHHGMFAIFLPGDAHCPKIQLAESEILRKVVVKIPSHLIK